MDILVYTHETNLLTEEERESYEYDPTIYVTIPEEILRAFYEYNDCAEEVAEELGIHSADATFEQWYYEVYTADSTTGLCQFSRDHGFEPVEAK